MPGSNSEQAALIATLSGQTLHIPSLTPLFQSWPRPATNPLYPSVLTPVVIDAITRIAAQRPSVARRLQDDIALLSALWYPTADRPRSEALALFAVWLVCWDDEVDASEGDLAEDLSRADVWRSETLRIIEASLELPGASMPDDVDILNQTVLSFGKTFASSSTLAQRRRLFAQASFFIRSTAIEQRIRLAGPLPTYAAYMTFRLGTVGGSLLCALIEYAGDGAVPEALLASEPAKRLETQVGVLLSLLNDLLSLKKELATGCALNAVATLLEPGRTLGEVVDEVFEKLQEAVSEFDTSAKQLLDNAANDENTSGAVERYIDGCRAIVTGTLEFTLRSPRYNISKLLGENGSLQIVL